MNQSADNKTEHQDSKKNKLPYYLLGGEAGVKELCKQFYSVMDELEDVKQVRAMHGTSLTAIEQKLFEYLSGWLGGPPIYLEKYGSVCLTDPHKLYKINEQARDQWLKCMDIALERVGANDELKQMLKQPLFDVANILRNC